MTTSPHFIKRRKRLATFLENLDESKFDINTWIKHDSNLGSLCGSAVCALGWCPVVFPRSWFKSECGPPSLRSNPSVEPYKAATLFFGYDLNRVFEVFATCSSRNNKTPKALAKLLREV